MPVVVIGGYLGAGKTTLVNHQLRQAGGRRIAVLVNDFGAVNIDADLIEGSDGGVLALSGGCLCCSFGDDLVGTLNALAGRTPPPDLCVIELSGVALPSAVVRTARLALGVQVVATLVVADAERLCELAADRYLGETVRRQLHDAHWLLLNKIDLVDPAQVLAAVQWLGDEAPAAGVLLAAADALPTELVFGRSASHQPLHCLDRPEGLGLGHRPMRGGSSSALAPVPFASRSVVLPDGCDLQALGAALADPEWGILRAKGLARDAQGRGHLLQVTGARWAVCAAPVQGPGRLVMIGSHEAIGKLPFDFPVLRSIKAAPQPGR